MDLSLNIVDDLDAAPYVDNLAEGVDQETLDALGDMLVEAIERDDQSRSGWMADVEDWLKLATQVREDKSFPWTGASNMKYPLMTTACMAFHARALPGLINSERPVQAKVMGNDPDGMKVQRAERVGRYMSYQILEDMPEWLDETDRMLFVLPMVGLTYKKTYYSQHHKRNRSILVLPNELILNYYATDYHRARMSHVIYMDSNEVIENQRLGLFVDCDLDGFDGLEEIPEGEHMDGERDEVIGLTPNMDSFDREYRVYESHCWLDLDGDGYKEPYIVTVDSNSRKILRIVARWDDDGISFNDAGDVVSIDPVEFFTPFILLPDPNSAVYGLGFGTLLGPTNESANTIINQLIDAGTLSNLQSGFIGRGAKLKGGQTRFRPGEWKIVNTTGDDLRKAIYPMPIREPSGTLFSLLEMLISAGQNITSVSDMMMGENPGQNQKATTTMAVLEQGLSVFKSIYKRLHRSFASELKKLYKLNYEYLDEDEYHTVLDDIMPQEIPTPNGPVTTMMPKGSREDFNPEDMNVIPTADPSIISDAQRLAKANSLLEKMAMGLPLNRAVVTKKVLEAEQQEDIEALMTIPPAPPPPEFQLEVVDRQIAAFEAFGKVLEQVAKAESLEVGDQLRLYEGVVDRLMGMAGLEDKSNSGQTNEPRPSPASEAGNKKA